MALPALSMLAGCHPDVVFWVHPRVAGLLPVFFPDAGIRTGSRFPGNANDRLLLMTGSFRSALQGFLSRIPVRTGYGTDMRRLLLTESLEPPAGREHHHSEDYIRLASAIGCRARPAVVKPCVEPLGAPHAAFFPGARYGSAKRWGGFGELASLVAVSTGLPVVLYGSEGEEEELRVTARGREACSVEAGLELPVLVSRLLKSVLTVGNDSGGVHLSALLGVPTVTVFGSTSPLWTAPSGMFTAEVTSSRECSPCFRRDCPKGRAACLSDITPRMVLDESLGLLRKSGAAVSSHV
ncbi:MAG: glycosyltransferase family 9 protein [Candidatus Fermentibacteraceae bacterium]|nr:glycosyltransferase family 9 protein [Candidatus Fermentibacteraceae bacterium]MBN2607660.1 glycosyltransferase family 9 protein [Candidatus Fermentibacteraceae bacterium]